MLREKASVSPTNVCLATDAGRHVGRPGSQTGSNSVACRGYSTVLHLTLVANGAETASVCSISVEERENTQSECGDSGIKRGQNGFA